MKKLILILGIVLLGFSSVKAEEMVYLSNGAQKVFQQINHQIERIKEDDRPLFKGWAEQEIFHFLQMTNAQLNDKFATSQLISKWGAFPELETKNWGQWEWVSQEIIWTTPWSYTIVYRVRPHYEGNTIIRSMVKNKIPTDLYFIGGTVLLYFIEDKIPKGWRSPISFISWLITSKALISHNKSETAPYDNTGREIPFTFTITW